MKFILIISLIIFLHVSNFSAYAADTLHLRNGDQLTGSITSYTSNQVDIQTKYGSFKIPVTDIRGVETLNRDSKYFIDQAVLQPTKNRKNNVTTQPTDEAFAEGAKKEKEVSQKKNTKIWGAKLSGNANLGAGLRTGNSETSNINADVNLAAKWEKHRASLKADFNREDDDGRVSVDNRSLELTHDYFVNQKWFLETSSRLEQDDIDLLDLRAIGSIGLGHQPFDKKNLTLKYVLGPGILYEEFDDGSGGTDLTTQWSLDYSQKFYDDLFRLFHEHDITTPVEDFNAFLFQSESGVRIPIRRGIIASGQIDFDWDNDPAEGTQEEDIIYSARIGYEWN